MDKWIDISEVHTMEPGALYEFAGPGLVDRAFVVSGTVAGVQCHPAAGSPRPLALAFEPTHFRPAPPGPTKDGPPADD